MSSAVANAANTVAGAGASLPSQLPNMQTINTWVQEVFNGKNAFSWSNFWINLIAWLIIAWAIGWYFTKQGVNRFGAYLMGGIISYLIVWIFGSIFVKSFGGMAAIYVSNALIGLVLTIAGIVYIFMTSWRGRNPAMATSVGIVPKM